jgi:hypothetical protein
MPKLVREQKRFSVWFLAFFLGAMLSATLICSSKILFKIAFRQASEDFALGRPRQARVWMYVASGLAATTLDDLKHSSAAAYLAAIEKELKNKNASVEWADKALAARERIELYIDSSRPSEILALKASALDWQGSAPQDYETALLKGKAAINNELDHHLVMWANYLRLLGAHNLHNKALATANILASRETNYAAMCSNCGGLYALELAKGDIFFSQKKWSDSINSYKNAHLAISGLNKEMTSSERLELWRKISLAAKLGKLVVPKK